MRKWSKIILTLAVLAVFLGAASSPAAENRGIEHGQRYDRVVIRNVIIIDGKGTTPRGPQDVIVEGNKIAAITAPDLRPDAYANGGACPRRRRDVSPARPDQQPRPSP